MRGRVPALGRLFRRLERLWAGSVVAPVPERSRDVERLLSRGVLWTSPEVRHLPARPNLCHRTVALKRHRHPARYDVATGYYLGVNDSVWRQHSWLIDKHNDQIVETTGNAATRYFGVRLNDREASAFVNDEIESEDRAER
jgi:hypothetical protein